MNDAVTVEVDWKLRDYAAAVQTHHGMTRSPLANFALRAVLAAALVAVGLIVAFVLGALWMGEALGDPALDRAFRHGARASFYGIAAAAVVFVVVRQTIWRRIVARRHRLGAFQDAPWSVTFSVAGIEQEGPTHRAHFDWSAVSDVCDMRRGLVVSLGPLSLLPVPDGGLPPGMTRAELKARILAWRGARDF